MAVLLDTHALLWWLDDSPELSAPARFAITDNDCRVSMASFWEIATKLRLGKLRLPAGMRYLPEQMTMNGFETLGITFRHTARTAEMPWHHRDPFDRLLAAQALEDKLTVVSRDPSFDAYGVKRVW